MQTTPKANNILGHLFALLGAVLMLAIATWVSASSSEQVQPLDNLTTPRTGHTATALADGRILITGGRDADGNLVAASEIFDPETQTSSASAALHTARVDHSATVLADGRVLVTGGSGDSGALSSAEIFDPAHPENGFTMVSSAMSTARTRHTATLLNSGLVLIAGGDAQGSAELFDPATGTFIPTIWPLTIARSGHTATLFADDSVLLTGGNTSAMEMYTPNQGFTLDPATMSVVRTGHWAFELSDTRLLLFQGDTGNTIDEFNPGIGTITPKGSLDFHASSSNLLANGKVLVLGAEVSGLYDPDAVPPAPDFTQFDETGVPHSSTLPRSGQSSTQLPGDKKILIAGGANTQNIFQGMALFNPARIWTDRDDYAPGDPVVLSGSGWKANENVYLYAVDDINQGWSYGATETAGADGSFVDSPYFIVQQQQLGAHFTVTAVGAQSNMQADVEFTDSITLDSVTVNSQVGTLTAGTAGSVTFPICITYHGNNTAISFSITSALPSGVTSSGFSPNPTGTTPVQCPSAASTLTLHTTAGVGAGSYPFTVQASDGTHTVTNAGTLVVGGGKNTPTITWFNPADITYGMALSGTQLNATATFNGNPVPGTFAYTPAAGTVLNAGNNQSLSVTFTPTDTTNFNNASANVTINVLKANAMWTTSANSKTYGDADPIPLTTGSGSGFLVSDGVSATYSRAAGESASPPTYHITATLSATIPGALNNYNITNNGNEFTINKRAATWTTNANSKTYGDPDPNPLTTGSGSGFLAADNVTATYTRAAGETVLGGPYHITATLSPANVLSNYTITNAGANFTINTKAATWTTNAASKTYGDADPNPLTTGSGSGFLAADNVTATYTRAAGETVTGGPYHITATLSPSHVLSNYSITNAGADFTIDTRPATWTTNAASKTYGDADPSPLTTGSGSNFLTGDNVTAGYSRDSGETVLGGPYHITATLSPAAVLSNYSITNVGAAFTITPKAASVTPNAASKTYGDADPAFTGTLSGFLAADGVTATYSRTAGESVAGSPYTISATLSPVGVLSNYTITYNTANFTIDPKAASVTPNAASKTYGDVDPAFSGMLTGFLAADGVTATYSRTAGETVIGGPYTISAVLSPAGVLSNYAITYNTASFTIDPKAASVTPNPATKVYGSPDPAFTGTLSGFLAADDVTATYSRTAGETVLGGPYTISATLSPVGVLSNYNITYNTAAFTITPKTASVTPNAASKTYGDADPVLTGSLSGFLAADGVTATYSRTAGESVAGGPYTISATLSPVGVLSNYSIAYNTANFTINFRNATWTTNPSSKPYGASDPNPLTTGSGSNFVDPVTAAYSRTAGETVAGNPYHITATLSAGAGVLANYNITNNGGNFTINPAPLTIAALNRTKVFGATYTPDTTYPSLDFSVSGLQFSDSVSSITLTCPGYAAGALPGSPYTITPSAAVFGVGSDGNYTISYPTGQLTIGYGNCSGGYVNAQIQQPINTDGSSVFKQGNTVPVKFTVCDAIGNPISDPAAVFPSGYGSVNMINTVRGTVNQVNETSTYDIPDSAFRWATDKWIFNMSTSNLQKNNTYNFRIYLKDGSFIAFTIGTK